MTARALPTRLPALSPGSLIAKRTRRQSRGSGDERWRELADRLVKTKAKYPGARVRPFNELTASFWIR
jgi:hypothetical protein